MYSFRLKSANFSGNRVAPEKPDILADLPLINSQAQQEAQLEKSRIGDYRKLKGSDFEQIVRDELNIRLKPKLLDRLVYVSETYLALEKASDNIVFFFAITINHFLRTLQILCYPEAALNFSKS